jgi:hypothetical protein
VCWSKGEWVKLDNILYSKLDKYMYTAVYNFVLVCWSKCFWSTSCFHCEQAGKQAASDYHRFP